MLNPEIDSDSAAVRRSATVLGIVGALPTGYVASALGSNLMSEFLGDESMAEIQEAQKVQDEEVLQEHTTDMLLYIGGTIVITVVAAATAYGYVKNRALRKWGSIQAQNSSQISEEGA